MIFQYPNTIHVRRHGPRGYRNAESFKPWLRDEFEFRCVYCLCQERWFPDGDASFSVDHLLPASRFMNLALEYDNLVYACCQCNSTKRDCDVVLDPTRAIFSEHLHIDDDGRIAALTSEGSILIGACRLDRPKLSEFRKGMLQLARKIEFAAEPTLTQLRQRIFGLPSNLPNLRSLRPPEGNARTEGIASSCFERLHER